MPWWRWTAQGDGPWSCTRTPGVPDCECMSTPPSHRRQLHLSTAATNRADGVFGSHSRVRGVWTLIRIIFRAARSSFRTKRELALENLALRHQIGVLTRALGGRRPRFRSWDRALWVVLARRWEAWRYALAIVQPATVVRWHREGFKRFWTRRSRAGRVGRPALGSELIGLIRKMSTSNVTWGAPRIRNELGIE